MDEVMNKSTLDGCMDGRLDGEQAHNREAA